MRSPLLLLAVVLLAACSSPPAPEKKQVRAQEPPQRDLLAEVRRMAADAGDVIEVAPLRDPAIDDLLQRAATLETDGDLEGAAGALEQALALSPQDPSLMQQRAELLLAQRKLDDAETLAWRSFEAGPKLGTLCRRNWATVQLAREERGDPNGAQGAARQLARCVVEPPVRM